MSQRIAIPLSTLAKMQKGHLTLTYRLVDLSDKLGHGTVGLLEFVNHSSTGERVMAEMARSGAITSSSPGQAGLRPSSSLPCSSPACISYTNAGGEGHARDLWRPADHSN